MKKRVKIISKPQARTGLEVRSDESSNAKQLNWPAPANRFSSPNVDVKKTIQPTSWNNANLEAEKGETVVTDLNHDGIPQHFTIGGKRHSEGGTPLNLPPDSFIFSRDKSMKIKDEDIQRMFNKSPKKSGYTPADMAKQYDINKYRKVLADPDTEDLQRSTAEMMIANYNLKLGKLALAQESKKGFPDGIPKIAMPYLETMQMNPEEFVQTQAEPTQTAPDNMGKYGMEVSGKKRVRILSLPKAQQGRTVVRSSYDGRYPGYGNPYPYPYGAGYGDESQTTKTTTTKTVKKQQIPSGVTPIKRSDYATDAEYITARDLAYKDAAGKKKVYTQDADGKYYIVGEKPLYEGTDGQLALIKERFSNPKVAQALKEQMLAAFDQKGAVTAGSGLTKKQIEDVTAEQLATEFYTFNQRNLKGFETLSNKLGTKVGPEVYQCFDNAKGTKTSTTGICGKIPYASFDELFTEAGVPLPTNASGKALQQLSYIGYKNLLDQRDAKGIKDEEITSALAPFKIGQAGVGDESVKGDREGSISQADGVYTNTTAGQFAGVEGSTIGEDLVGDTEVDETTTGTDVNHLGPEYRQPGNAPWWLQDIIRTAGAAGDMARIKKYMPWQATPQVYLPSAVFHDPNRELAANAEQSNIMAQNLAAFAGPQALSSRTSQIQGQGAKNAADIMGRYSNMNVGIANNLESQKAQIMNQASSNRAGLATQLFDKNTIANQQFDNAKNMARQNLRQSYMDAITNKEMTYNMNQLFPQYQVRPDIGGGIEFTQGRRVTPENASNTKLMDTFKTYSHDLPGVDDATVLALAKAANGQPDLSSSIDPNYLAMLQAQMYGQ